MPGQLSDMHKRYLRSLGLVAMPLADATAPVRAPRTQVRQVVTPAAPVRKTAPPPPSPEQHIEALVKAMVAAGADPYAALLRVMEENPDLRRAYRRQHFARAEAATATLAKARSQGAYDRAK